MRPQETSNVTPKHKLVPCYHDDEIRPETVDDAEHLKATTFTPHGYMARLIWPGVRTMAGP